jgi:hypothetical protein
LNLRRAFLGVAACAIASSGAAQSTQPDPVSVAVLHAAAKDSLRIYLMTMGQGDDIYELFGHNAIWVHDPRSQIDTVYNWGVFSFDQPHFILRFLRGRNEFYMWPFTLEETVAEYQQLNRRVWAQELNFTDAEKRSLLDFLHWNVEPANRPYRYNYYLDNCSTRVRDALDRATGGQIRSQLKAQQTNETYRGHSLRMMQGMPAIVSGVELLLGEKTDKPLTADGASFLPVQLMNHLAPMKLDNGTRALIKQSFVVNDAKRAPEPTTIPRLWLWFLPVSIALSALVLWLGASARRGVRPRVAAVVYTFLAAVIGIIGTIVVFLVTMTDHTAAQRNFNGFMLNPLWLAVAVLAPLMLLRPRWRGRTRRFLLACAGISLLAVIARLTGISHQSNWDAMLLILPVELAMVWQLTHLPRPAEPA